MSEISNYFLAESKMFQQEGTTYSEMWARKRQSIQTQAEKMPFRMPKYCAVSGFVVEAQPQVGFGNFQHVFDMQ